MTKNCCEIDMRHDRFQAIISGANPIPPGAIRMADRRWPGRRRTWTWATPHTGTFARTGY
jgi:hypothetical protein